MDSLILRILNFFLMIRTLKNVKTKILYNSLQLSKRHRRTTLDNHLQHLTKIIEVIQY